MQNRNKYQRRKNRLQIAAAIILSILFILAFSSFAPREEEPTKQMTTYTVQKGDTLYSIAEDLGIKNWRKFAYETCELNGIEQGGLIHPGQEIIVMH